MNRKLFSVSGTSTVGQCGCFVWFLLFVCLEGGRIIFVTEFQVMISKLGNVGRTGIVVDSQESYVMSPAKKKKTPYVFTLTVFTFTQHCFDNHNFYH